MACVTTCSKCGKLYEESSEECANEPGRMCTSCRRSQNSTEHRQGPLPGGSGSLAQARGAAPAGSGTARDKQLQRVAKPEVVAPVVLRGRRPTGVLPIGPVAPWKIFVFLALCYLVVGTIDYAAARSSVQILLDVSTRPADWDECWRAAPELGRPDYTISFQGGNPAYDNSVWFRRTCYWRRR